MDYEADENYISNRKSNMNWNHWKNTMALDTVEYYKFLYPNTAYFYTEPTTNGTTLISPYVVIDGALQGIHMLWIDNRLFYSRKAEQLEAYTFNIEPGYHYLKFRTHNREITVKHVFIERYMKNIISFNANGSCIGVNPDKEGSTFVVGSRLLHKSMWGKLTDEEIGHLTEELITVDNNFGKMELPNIPQIIDIPGYISTGGSVYYLNHITRNQYNRTLRSYVNSPVLAGPFPRRNVINSLSNMARVYAEDKIVANIELEGGNQYTLYPGFQKIKSWEKLPFDPDIASYTPQVDFKQNPSNANIIRQHVDNRLKKVLAEANGIAGSNKIINQKQTCRLDLYLGKNAEGKQIRPVLIFIVPEKAEDIANYQLYYGGTRYFKQLPAGQMNVSLIFNDSTSYTQPITLHPGGQNYIRLDSIQYETNTEVATTAFRVFNRAVKKTFTRNPYSISGLAIDSIVKAPEQLPEGKRRGNKAAISGIVRDGQGELIIGASIFIDGTDIGTISDMDGYFELSAGSPGNQLVISFIGYKPKTVKISNKSYYEVKLEEDYQMLEEVVVVGYGAQKKSSLTGSVSTVLEPTMAGAMPGIMIRGNANINNEVPPLMLVNGLPYQGRLEDIDPATVTTIEILKAATATAIYGSRAANGVVIIHTKDGRINAVAPESDEFPALEAGNTMRRNFHDNAFWQPRLRTNKKGEASFEVTYPDDITSWDAYFIAVGDKKQTDKRQMTIKSFKALAARLSAPRFAVRGDSLNAIGRIANHLGDTISVVRKITVKGNPEEQEDNLTFATSHVDRIPVIAGAGDSLTIAYSLQMNNGYFDGEERSIPIVEPGMQRTHGEFKILNDTATYVFQPNPALGNITLHAEASGLELFLREIEKVDSYPYMCNEQMASKVEALLLKKRIAELFGMEFKEEKKIIGLINRINKNKNADGLWGWWNKSNTEFWISEQVLNALLHADDAGYDTKIDKQQLIRLFEHELKQGLSDAMLITARKAPWAKQGLLDRLLYLKRLDAPIDYKGYLRQIDEQLESQTVADRLKTMKLMCAIGLKDEVNTDTLMHYSRKTIFGSLFWGDVDEDGISYRNFMLPYQNNTENTLMAYSILKTIGGCETEMEKVRNYFFEHRQGRGWANTYESSRIIETIMPDMLTGEKSFAEVNMNVNGKNISKFPFTDTMDAGSAPIRIKKEGTMPLYITTYQQAWNAAPKCETTKGFAVETVFKENRDTICSLTAGKTAQLEILVKVDAHAEYVQIEVPIPAGCSYESKNSGNYWKEVHREYFKDRVVIFCNKLSAGEHRFTVELIPRYTGRYALNPAKVELMYFPVFYGNNEMKTMLINP
ncbi:carboxypeptidase-like regulatory domain-containing protein [Bacteroides sp. OttesenSCG-928-N06]|nr:carboxypeptidase-like regulatory domain-containing protein [Bacteroides sp. OttesenSCG-928-N06]